MKMREFSLIAIGPNPKNEMNMILFSQENIRSNDLKKINIYAEEFFMIYPVMKQMVISFGEGANYRLGLDSTSNTLPKAAY